MSSEAVVKKRGRPKKTDKIDSNSGKQDGEVVTTSKRSTTSRPMTTTKASSKEATLKKPGRRKKLAQIDDIEATNEQLIDEIDSRRTAKEMHSEAEKQPSKSRILNEARAFKKMNPSAVASARTSASADGKLETSSNGTPASGDSQPPPSDQPSIRPARNNTTSESPLPPSSSPSSTPPASSIKNSSPRSSFLSGFLSDAPDPVPEAPESSKISDRSAFNSQPLSVDEIVSGTGVTDLASLTATTQQAANVKRERESAIPITAPKSFKSHNLNVFPDKAQQQKVKAPPAQKYINPGTYALGSFKNFKESPQSAAAPSSPAVNSSSATSSTKQSPQIPPTSTLSQIQSKAQQHQKATIQTSSSPTPSNPPQASSISSSRPTPSSPSTRLPKPPLPHPSTTTQDPTGIPLSRPKRPTQMTMSELLKDPEFKSLRRKYTGLIVGIPVLVVTSWLLWDRMDREDKGLTLGEVAVVEEKRRRGELPKRILDDGGLERGR